MEKDTSKPSGAAAQQSTGAIVAAAGSGDCAREAKDAILPWKVGNIYPVIHGRLSFAAHHDDEHVRIPRSFQPLDACYDGVRMRFIVHNVHAPSCLF
jgi:hypothetical protein